MGAGPAGATAARCLAIGGARVQLVDRERFPRNKPCGGAISMRVLTRFPYLRDALPRISTHYISRLCLESPGRESLTLRSKSPAALMVRRFEFDDLLVRLAVEAGAELIEGLEISQASMTNSGVTLVARDGRTLQASLVIAADGVHSVTARRLGFNTGWPRQSIALDMMEETPNDALRAVDPDTLWVSYGYQRSDGYAYVFPKRDHVNVGIGCLLSYYRGQVRQPPYDLQRHLVETLCGTGVLRGGSRRRYFTPFLIPVGGPLRRTVGERVLVAGDAGGFVNGFTAEGIYYAMVSGELAAKSVIGTPARSVSTLARRYRRACDHEMGAELRDSVLIQRYLFADRRRIARVIESARRAPAATRLIVDFVSGRIRYPELRRRLLLQAPGLVGPMLWERLRATLWRAGLFSVVESGN